MSRGEYSGDWENAPAGTIRTLLASLLATPGAHAGAKVKVNDDVSSRQALTSSGALMALDRPGLVYKDLC